MRINGIIAQVVILCLSFMSQSVGRAGNPAFIGQGFGTIQVRQSGYPLSSPIMLLGGSDKLQVSWDERNDNMRYLRYRLLHCNRDWKPSRLLESEWLDGINESPVEQISYSRLVKSRYVHYQIELPAGNTQLLTSGNYLIEVYDEEDPDKVLIKVPFYVTEQLTPLSASVSSRTDVDINAIHQQITVDADISKLDNIVDPFSNFTLEISQNGRYDNLAVVKRPLRIEGDKLIFEHDPAMIFPAGNEYRRFETVSTGYPGRGVESIEWNDPFYHYQLATDAPRAEDNYIYDSTQNGKYVVRNADGSDLDNSNDVEADYGVVHFSLDAPRMPDADIYLDGDFTLRQFNPDYKMIWNEDAKRYEASLLLKQGSYNYQYLTLPHGASVAKTADIEGDKFQTVNEYTVRLYYRQPGGRADRLLGVTTIKSGR